MEEKMYPGEEPMYWALLSLAISALLIIFFKYYLIPVWAHRRQIREVVNSYGDEYNKIHDAIYDANNFFDTTCCMGMISLFEKKYKATEMYTEKMPKSYMIYARLKKKIYQIHYQCLNNYPLLNQFLWTRGG
ncbi:MAG: hypothetical protein IPJ81_03865 [Chitinophagaceae bacterium]|nr:hypothetical protein [Chitinophagaceae bacterium]